MFENVDELIEVNLKLLYASKSQYMMRINFKDEYGFNLKNSKVFAEVLVSKGLVVLECNQGFRCDLTDLGKQVYVDGGWIKYLKTVDLFENQNIEDTIAIELKQQKKSFFKKFTIASIAFLVLCVFITLITVEMFKNS
jgi:hypothetical protein